MLDAHQGHDRTPPDIEAEFARERLLERYANGRVAHFLSRQTLTLAGGLTLAVVEGPLIGLLAGLCALAGEAVDCLVLARVPPMLKRGVAFSRLSLLVSLTAGLQALSIAVCVLLSWGAADARAPLFAIAFLAGAAVNGGVVLPFHRGAALARLTIYAATLVLGFVLFRRDFERGEVEFLLNVSGAVVLLFMVQAVLTFALNGAKRNLIYLRDMARHRRELETANLRLQQSQKEAQQLALAVRNANDSVVLLDAAGCITWVNQGFTRITGYPMEEAIGRRPGDLLNGPETSTETIAEIERAAAEGRPFRGEIRNRTRSGNYVWIESNQMPVLDAQGRVEMVVAIERDVTEARQIASDLARAKERAEAGARVKAEFLANMSHEIRTPMNGVIGMADMLCETGLSGDQRLYAETIRDSAQSLLGLINDILDLSKLDAGKMAITPADFDLHGCLESTVTMFRAQAEGKGLALRLELAEALPRHVRADDTRLRQILVNLLGNAIKFTEQGEVRVAARPLDATWDGRIVIEVADTGIGIAPGQIDQVFERFSQAESDTSRRFGGTGLGLTISHMLAKAMGGEITVRSAPGAGSCFAVSLVVDRAKATGGPAPPAASGFLPAALAGRRVLVAEDNKVNRLLVQRFLRDTELALHFAHNGREAVEMVRALVPDVVLMDMSMPEMNGIEAARAIRQMDIAQPAIVALTANAFDSDRAACLAAGMDGFLTKPVRRDELLRALARYGMATAGQAAH